VNTPQSVVLSWWQSMQDKDLPGLERMTLEDYVSAGGPGGRTVGRDQFVAEAEQFMANAAIQDWSVTDLEVRQHGAVAVCSYFWTECGMPQEVAFDLRGVATDVLVLWDGQWRHQVHHVTMVVV
jgi:ketosteroid isomerase-like protein